MKCLLHCFCNPLLSAICAFFLACFIAGAAIVHVSNPRASLVCQIEISFYSIPNFKCISISSSYHFSSVCFVFFLEKEKKKRKAAIVDIFKFSGNSGEQPLFDQIGIDFNWIPVQIISSFNFNFNPISSDKSWFTLCILEKKLWQPLMLKHSGATRGLSKWP